MEKERKEKADPEVGTGPAPAQNGAEKAFSEQGYAGDEDVPPAGEQGKPDGDSWVRQKEELIELVQRKQADLDNFRRISRRKEEEIRSYGLFDFLEKLLPVLDNLERALDTAYGEGDVPETHCQGLEMIRKQLLQLLEQEGVEPITALGQAFDPHFHEAVICSAEAGGEPGSVVEEVQKGYLYKERVLRPAKVAVK